MRLPLLTIALSTCLAASACLVSFAQSAPPAIALDEYLNNTAITEAHLSPDGAAAVIATESPDWIANTFRHDLWLWTAAGGLKPLTHSGSEENAAWSPDGKWIAFLSDRALDGETAGDDGAPASTDSKASRLWVISVSGGEALPLFREKLDVHAFAWSPNGASLFYAVTEPLTPEQQETQKAEWKDVVRWREQNRGDVLLSQPLAPALERSLALAGPHPADTAADAGKDTDKKKDTATIPAGAAVVTRSPDSSITELTLSPDGNTIAFETGPPHKRIERLSSYDIFTVPAAGGKAHALTRNNGIESELHWSPDGRWIHFIVAAAAGSVEDAYHDTQGRLYRIDPSEGTMERLGAQFDGSWDQYALLPDGRELALGLKGTQDQVYLVEADKATKLPGRPGSYAGIDSALHANAVLLRHSAINVPTQAFLAADPLHPGQLTPLTSFNPLFAQRAQPEWQPYTWKADDGVTVEGVLLFPPGKKGAKHLRMLTFIHGGPADADGDRFGADWYDWATLAAANGWLVFRPNYRGSAGYGDDFLAAISPHLVSKPGRDILAGVDALVKDGYADPGKLAIGGYSYGGYMTNWLITQTNRFKAAVTGAGAIEHAANWGNDDETLDDAWYLGGTPWENPAIYQSEAALFRLDKVTTPTHIVQGMADVRVSYLEGVAMERALQSLGVPHAFLAFPGEGHGLPNNPWHGYIKLREELKWLDKYCPQ